MADVKEERTKWIFLYRNYSTAQKVRQTSRVTSQYTSEADLSELLLAGPCFTFCACSPHTLCIGCHGVATALRDKKLIV